MGQFDPDYRYEPKWPTDYEVRLIHWEIMEAKRREEEGLREIERRRDQGLDRQAAWLGLIEEERRRGGPNVRTPGPPPDWF